MMIGGPTYIGIADYIATDNFGVAFTSTIERQGIDCGNPNTIKTLQRSRWHIDGPCTAQIYHGSSMTADGTVTYASPVNYTPASTDFACARATAGRYLAVKATLPPTTDATPVSTKLRSSELDFTEGGTR